MKTALLGTDAAKAEETAREIRSVAAAVQAATANDGFDLAGVRDLAVKAARKIDNPRLQVLVTEVIDIVTPLVQVHIDEQLAELKGNQKIAATRRLVSAATQGAIDATDLWITPAK